MKVLLRKVLSLISIFCVSLIVTQSSEGHSGGLDASGGHWDRKNGTYHTHRPAYTPSSTPSVSSGSKPSTPVPQVQKNEMNITEVYCVVVLEEIKSKNLKIDFRDFESKVLEKMIDKKSFDSGVCSLFWQSTFPANLKK